ncbi:MAG: aminotransferase class I/II-fold pyridoxal phosphate-dependent enzyme [Saccharofermentanales bacterium]
MNTDSYLPFGITPAIVRQGEAALARAAGRFNSIRQMREKNQLKVLQALQSAGLSESQLGGTTGYGYNDLGREQIERAYAQAFGAEAALVRIQISSGTQALALCLFGLLRPGDELLVVTGKPYDSLAATLGISDVPGGHKTGSLGEFGVRYREVQLLADGRPDLAAIAGSLTAQTRVVYVQKSRGYSSRPSLLAADIAAIRSVLNERRHSAVLFVDNCYGEFVEAVEPCAVGADLCAGSLIKNPGAGISPSGAYICGKAELVEQAANRLTAPGIGSHVGPSLGFNRQIALGFYQAPHIVAESLMGAVFAAELFSATGYRCLPAADSARGDIVQTIEFGSPEPLVAFCQAIQAASPVDAYVLPEPGEMPGYDCDVIMASGSFTSGSSIELSADGPLRPPYLAFLQGGLNFDTTRLGCLLALQRLTDKQL